MTRISDIQLSRSLIDNIINNRESVNRYGEEVSTGIIVSTPGDSNLAGTVAQFRDTLTKIDGFKARVGTVRSFLTFQEEVVAQADQLMIRAKEIASQAANETWNNVSRQQMAAEVWQLRDHMVSLANSQYLGKYVYGGADDDDPPFDATTYTNPSTGSASQRYIFDNESGTATTRSVKITDDLTITVNNSGNTVFTNSIQALERLGRALEGYNTIPESPVPGGAPDGTGNAFTFPAEYGLQTADIRDAINLIDTARETNLAPERVTLGGKLRRLDTADALLDLSQSSSAEALGRIQDADIATSASNLTLAQTALQASMTVTARVLNQSILDFI